MHILLKPQNISGRGGGGGSQTTGVQRGAPRRREEGRDEGGRNGQVLRLGDRPAGHLQVRRLHGRRRLHQRLPPGEVLPRQQDRHDLRGHEQHAALHHRQGPQEGIRLNDALYIAVLPHKYIYIYITIYAIIYKLYIIMYNLYFFTRGDVL